MLRLCARLHIQAPDRLLVLALGAAVPALGCGGDDTGGSGEVTSASVGTDTSVATNTSDDTSSAGSTTQPVPPGCGNGVVEGDEACDDGEMNSDDAPDACRTSCRAPMCRDSVIDSGEECDDGFDNSDFDPNVCRLDCSLPSCGDGVTDTGERCDDGNDIFDDGCFECTDRFYFVLNAPAGGDISIVRTPRDGPAVTIVSGDASLAGMRKIEIAPGGSTLYGLQSGGGTHRVVFIDPVAGDISGEVAIDQSVLGYEPDARAMALAGNGNVYVALSGGGSTRVIEVDPTGMSAAEVLDLASATQIVDMTADDANFLFMSTGSDGTIVRIDVSGPSFETFGDGADGLTTPQGLFYDVAADTLSVVNNAGGNPNVVQSDPAGTFTPFITSMEGVGADSSSMIVDVGEVITVTARDQDRVAALEFLGGVQTLFDDMIDSPMDIETIVLTP